MPEPASPTPLRACVAEAVADYLAARVAALGRPATVLRDAADLFEAHILDSLSIAGLVAAVERATQTEIDFMNVDPDELGTVEGIVDALTRAIAAR